MSANCALYALTSSVQIMVRANQLAAVENPDEVAEEDLLPYVSVNILIPHAKPIGKPRAISAVKWMTRNFNTTEAAHAAIQQMVGRRNLRLRTGDPKLKVRAHREFRHSGRQHFLSDQVHAELMLALQNGYCFIGAMQFMRGADEVNKQNNSIYGLEKEDQQLTARHYPESHAVCVVGGKGEGSEGYYVYLNSFGPEFGQRGIGRVRKKLIVEVITIIPELNGNEIIHGIQN